jgi:hypothetical protein
MGLIGPAAGGAIIEELLALLGTMLIAIDPPYFMLDYAAHCVLDKVQPAGQFYDRARNGGGDLVINANNQGQWNNIVEMIAGDDSWANAIQGISDNICDTIKKKGATGTVTWQNIRDDKLGWAVANLQSKKNLAYSLGNVYTPFEWSPLPETEDCCKLYRVRVWVEDSYNFEIEHWYKKMQDNGAIRPYHVTIIMFPFGDFEKCCD